jgi:hypothetical protein
MHRLYFGLLTACALAGGAATALAESPARCPSTQTSTFSNNDPTTGRLTLDNTASKCGGTKAFPGANDAASVRYQTFAYENRTNADACVHVSVTATSGEVEAAAFLGGFSATNLALGYLGDPGGAASALSGSTKGTQSFAFNVPALRPFTVMVEETVHGAGGSYSVNVTDCGQVVATKVRPVFGPVAGGQSVAIDGEGFLSGATATLGGAAMTKVSANETLVTGTSGAHAAGVVDVVVTNGDGSSTTLKGAYTYLARAPSSVALKASPASPVAGQPITLTAQVAGKNDPGTIDGTVSFFDGATALGKASVGANGAASITAALHAGAHALTAKYEGGQYFDPSTSAPVAEAVGKAKSAASLAASQNPATPGVDVAFTATILAAAPGAGAPTGQVIFSEGAATLGTAALDATGSAKFTTKALATGTHAITATYSGDADFTASTANAEESVDPNATQVAVTSPGGSLYGWPVRFTVTVGASNASTPTGSVALAIDGTPATQLTLDATGTASFETADLGAGSHDVTATYAGDAQNKGGTAEMTQEVQKADVNVTITASEGAAADGVSVTVSVSAQRGDPPSGGVSFSVDQGPASYLSLVAGTATTTLFLSAGSHDLAASFGGDANHSSGIGDTSFTMRGDVNPDAGVPVPFDAGPLPIPDYDAGIPDYTGWDDTPVEAPQSDMCACTMVGGSAPRSFGGLLFGAAATLVVMRRRQQRRTDRR